MNELTLRRKRRSLHYPAEVKLLIDYILCHKRTWPIVADYLRTVTFDRFHSTPSEVSRQIFDDIAVVYLPDLPVDDPLVEELWKLVQGVYSLSSKDTDPRALVVEYFVYAAGPMDAALKQSECSQREYQCTVCRRRWDLHPDYLVASEASFDAVFLSDACFEGYECKVKLETWLRQKVGASQLDKRAKTKLDFMTNICVAISAEGLRANMFLAGLERSTGQFKCMLEEYGYESIGVLGADELEQLMA